MHISLFHFRFCFKIRFFLEEISIHIILWLHHMMRYKDCLLFFLQILHSSAWSWSSWFIHQSISPEAVHSAHSSEYKDILKTYFKFCALSFLKGGFSPCGFAYFLIFLDKIIIKGDHSLVVGPYIHLYVSICILLYQTYHHKFRLKGGCWDIIKPLHT